MEDSRAANLPAQALGMIQGRGSSDIVRQIAIQLRLKIRVLKIAPVSGGELLQREHQGFSNKLATVGTEVPTLIRK